jgi:hypothetical protein
MNGRLLVNSNNELPLLNHLFLIFFFMLKKKKKKNFFHFSTIAIYS